MLNFKQRDEMLPSVLILLSVLILAATLIYMVAVPPPTAAGVVKGRTLSRMKVEEDIAKAKTRSAEIEQMIRPRLWRGNPEAVTASVLAEMTNQANRRALKLTAFRPQRVQTLEGMTELPFSVQVSGPYAAIRSVLSSLDAPGSRLAIRSIQVASADAASSAVTATIGVSAYIDDPKAGAAKSTPSSSTTRKANGNG